MPLPVRDVLAAGGADIETRGRTLHVVDPELVRDPARSLLPRLVRVPVRLVHVDEFLTLRERTSGERGAR